MRIDGDVRSVFGDTITRILHEEIVVAGERNARRPAAYTVMLRFNQFAA
jgi:hypothetical protein